MTPDSNPSSENAVDPREAAETAGLVYVSDEKPGIRRRKAGRGFSYVGPGGGRVSDKATLERIRSLAIPPAYSDVWICPRADGHIQATGRDARGRKQYRYHPAFRAIRESTKYEHMIEFAKSLPAIRRTIDGHMRLRGLPRQKVLATVVNLLENTLIRIGNADYAKQNRSYGLTTLRNPHVKVDGPELRFQFTGKSGRTWRLAVRDRRIARIVKACQELPGQDLFQYLDENGGLQSVTSADVNDYLKEITGRDITAKDFRTWAGTVLAALALAECERFDGGAAARKNIRVAIEKVSSRLGNTPTICRKCYVHPEIIACYLEGCLVLGIKAETGKPMSSRSSGLKPEETAVLSLLQDRLVRDSAPRKRKPVRRPAMERAVEIRA